MTEGNLDEMLAGKLTVLVKDLERKVDEILELLQGGITSEGTGLKGKVNSLSEWVKRHERNLSNDDLKEFRHTISALKKILPTLEEFSGADTAPWIMKSAKRAKGRDKTAWLIITYTLVTLFALLREWILSFFKGG